MLSKTFDLQFISFKSFIGIVPVSKLSHPGMMQTVMVCACVGEIDTPHMDTPQVTLLFTVTSHVSTTIRSLTFSSFEKKKYFNCMILM